MYQEFLTYVEKHLPEIDEGKTLLAVSGGMDSMVLAHLFLKSNWSFGIVHCNFQLRANDSDEDESFVTAFSTLHNIPIHVRKFDTESYATQNGISIQMAARDLRYGLFNELLISKYNNLAIAHHKDDQYETVLFNLIKGTGIQGLIGWKPKKGRVLRPLLFTSKSEINKYALDNQVAWREDSSNEQTDYTRNKIRHLLIPTISEINSGYLDTFENTKLRLSETARVLQDHHKRFRKEAVKKSANDILINKNLVSEDPSPVLSLYSVLKPMGFNLTQCREICSTLKEVGNLFESATHIANIDRDDVIVSPRMEDHEEVEIGDISAHVFKSGDSLSMETIPNHSSIDLKTENQNVCLFDKDKLHFPLIIRKTQTGDSFYPLGLNGKKKVSDFMIDEKIPVNLKRRVLILESAKNVVWIIGQRIDDRYKVTPHTTKILRMTYSYA